MDETRQLRSRSKKKRKGGKFRLFIGIVLILIAVGLLLLDPIKNYRIQQVAETNLVNQLDRERIIRNQNTQATYDFNSISNINTLSALTMNVNPNDLPVIGGIAIPDVSMNLPIYHGATEENMYYGAGTLREGQKMGESNYPLSSHHSKDPNLLFAPLMRVEYGDSVYVTDLDKIYEYKVDHIETVTRDRVDVIDETDEDVITLITCTYDLIDSYIVRGTLNQAVDIEEAPKEMLEVFELEQTIVQ